MTFAQILSDSDKQYDSTFCTNFQKSLVAAKQ
jgi:hypothetical protein